MKQIKYLPYSLLVIALLVSSCAPETVNITNCAPVDSPPGFWLGLWHGTIAPITFIISLFSDSVSVYSVYNSGGWYDFGFVLGAGILSFGSSKANK